MRGLLYCGIALLAAAFLVSCATTPPNPVGPTDSIVVGQLSFTLSGFSSHGSVVVNGTHRSDVTLFFADLQTGKTVETRLIAPTGMFFFSGHPSDRYVLEKLLYASSSGGYTRTVTLLPGRKLAFDIAGGQVNNLGMIDATFNSKGTNSVRSLRGFDELQTTFRKTFPKSKWNSWKWADLFPKGS